MAPGRKVTYGGPITVGICKPSIYQFWHWFHTHLRRPLPKKYVYFSYIPHLLLRFLHWSIHKGSFLGIIDSASREGNLDKVPNLSGLQFSGLWNSDHSSASLLLIHRLLWGFKELMNLCKVMSLVPEAYLTGWWNLESALMTSALVAPPVSCSKQKQACGSKYMAK